MIEIAKIKQLVCDLVDYVQIEQAHIVDKKDSFLYSLFGEASDGNFKFYEQADALFKRDEKNPRQIKITLEYPKDKSILPCYVIREPGKDKGPTNSIGKNFEGENGILVRDSRAYSFEIMCVSLNFLESILMSETLYALLLASHDFLASNYNSISFRQMEVIAQTELMPTPIFLRSINLSLSSSVAVRPLVNMDLLGKIIFQSAEIAAAEYGNVMTGRDFSIGVESEILG